MGAPSSAPSTVEEEAARLKAALRDLTARDDSAAHEAADDQAAHRPGDDCPVCRASRLVHAVAPELLDEVGRGITAVGRLVQDAARELRRHTPDQATHHTTHEGES